MGKNRFISERNSQGAQPSAESNGPATRPADNKQTYRHTPGTPKGNGKPKKPGRGREVGRAILLVIIVMILIGATGAIIGLTHITMIEWWLPWAIALPLAGATGLWGRKMWAQLTRLDSPTVNYLIHLVAFTILFATIFLVANAAGDGTDRHSEQAVVERLFREKHHRTRRVGRRTYAQGEAYYTYHLQTTIRGRQMKLAISQKNYRDLNTGDTVSIPMRRGALGFTILSPMDLEQLSTHPKRVKARKHIYKGL